MKYQIKVNDRLKDPRIIVKDDGSLIFEVRSEDKNNSRLHKEMLQDHNKWIKTKVNEKERSKPHPISKDYNFVNGTAIYIKGKHYRLKIDKTKETKIEGKYLVVSKVSKAKIREKIKNFMVENYSEYIYDKVKSFSQKLGLEEPKVELKEFKNKLGSCKGDQVSFDWRILKLNPHLIDYVILHEMVHLMEMSHGEAFWSKLKQYMSDYLERSKEIRVLRAIIFEF